MSVNRICRKCLTEDITEERFAKLLDEYLESIEAEIRTPEKEYKQRLSLCLKCGNYINGMCALCGCFVKIRAARAGGYCPNKPAKW